MTMTARERTAKSDLLWVLARDGYKAYAEILKNFDLNLTRDPDTVAYTQIGKGRIVVNENLRLNQVSMVVRHEILHNFLDHEKRMLKHLAQQANLDYDTLTDTDFNKLQRQLYSNSVFNIAGDFEISNRGYTEEDKKTAKNLWLNGKKVEGLVTEIDKPELVDMSIEDMYDKLSEEREQTLQQLAQSLGNGMQGDSSQSQSGSKDSGRGSGSTLRIGDIGNAETQAKEDEEREAQAAKEREASGKQDDRDGKDAKDAADAISKGAKDLSKEMSKGKSSGAKGVADDLKDVADDAESLSKDIGSGKVSINKDDDLSKRVERIEKAFSDAAMKAAAIAEVDARINQEKIDKRTQEILNYLNSGMNRFKNSLGRFIKKATAEQQVRTYLRPSRRAYDAPGEPLIKGKQWQDNKHIPMINVYFDQSGSWTDDDVQLGLKAIGILNNYQKRGEIKLNIKFFSNTVHTSAAAARAEGGTYVEAVMQDIIKTKPDNVIILTDSDSTSDNLTPVQVPGAVWLLFKNGLRSQALINSIKGRAQTSVFDLEGFVD